MEVWVLLVGHEHVIVAILSDKMPEHVKAAQR